MVKIIKFGGDGPPIQFLHANGYAPEVYTKFLSSFLNQFEVNALRLRPFWPDEAANKLKTWHLFVDDLIKMMDDLGHTNVIGIGHSLGAVVSWLASVRRPDLFSRLILIDPVILPLKFIRLSQFSPYWLQKRQHPMIKTASNRRNVWKDEEEARAHLGGKKVYQRFDKEVFDDFIRYNLKSLDEGLTLAYSREWEARVYASAPNVWSHMSKTTVPIHIIKAQYSDVITAETWRKIQDKTPNGSFYEMPGVGHLVPMEKPDLLAKHILSVLAS